MKEKILSLVDSYWKFDDNQTPVSNWHDKQDLLREIESLFPEERPAIPKDLEDRLVALVTDPVMLDSMPKIDPDEREDAVIDEISEYMSSLDKEDLERFCAETGVPRDVDIYDLVDFNFNEWPENMVRLALRWLVMEGLLDAEQFEWLG